MASNFQTKLIAFNRMYGLPALSVPAISRTQFPTRAELINRLAAFRDILLEEIDEVHQLMVNVNRDKPELEVLTELADWLGDLQVYCASEMAKFGLDNDKVLDIIMDSNMSKLGVDGKPIKDGRGKVMKGPGYWKPEPKIAEYIKSAKGSS